MLHLRMLGRLSLERDGEPLTGFESQRRALAILAILAVEGQATRDRLMALLWPESDSARARGSLKQALHQLRHTLGDRDVITGSSALRLDTSAIRTDAGQFLAALGQDDTEAVSLYAGPLLDGVHFGGPAELDQWVDEKRADLAAGWASALERLATEAEKEGDPHTAADRWKRLQAHDHTDSRITLRLMLALEAAGRRAAALMEAQDHQRRLKEEWELSADPAVDQLAARLRAGSLGPASPPPSPYYERAASAPPPDAPMAAPNLRGPRIPLLIGALVVVAAAVGMLRPGPGRSSAAASDPNLVAVPPFDAFDPSVALWSEGLADVLIRDLDGAGPLRTVSAATAFRDWGGNADRTSATALGQRTGAGIVVFGSISRLDSANVALRAWILDSGADHYAAELEVRGPESGMGRLADSLSRSILVALGQDRPIASARRVSLASTSLAALREFLRGEQFYRRGGWDSAMAHYARAVDADTAMALAYKRMSMVSGWGARAPGEQPGDEYIVRAVVLNHGLAPRDSLILAADSMGIAAARSPDARTASHYFHRGLAALEQASQRYPDDPDVLYHLAEARMHLPILAMPRQILEAFEHAIAHDPDYLAAYEHAVDLAFQVGEPGRAAAYARTASALASGYDQSVWHQLVLVLDSGPASNASAAALSNVPARQLLILANYLRWDTDSAEAAIEVLRRFRQAGTALATDGALVIDSTLRASVLAMALAFRGHLKAAAGTGWQQPTTASVERTGRLVDPLPELALFGAVPDSLARATFDSALAPGADWTARGYSPRLLRGAPWWFARRDTAALRQFADRAALVAGTAHTTHAAERGRYLSAAASGYLALARGDSAGAVRILSAIPDELCITNHCHHEKLTLAQLLLASGKPGEAASVLDNWGTRTSFSALSSWPTPSAVIAAFERARAAEALADTATARRHYRFVANAWQHADRELQHWVTQAREGGHRLNRSTD